MFQLRFNWPLPTDAAFTVCGEAGPVKENQQASQVGFTLVVQLTWAWESSAEVSFPLGAKSVAVIHHKYNWLGPCLSVPCLSVCRGITVHYVSTCVMCVSVWFPCEIWTCTSTEIKAPPGTMTQIHSNYHIYQFKQLRGSITHPDRQTCGARHRSEPAASCLYPTWPPNWHRGFCNSSCTSVGTSALPRSPRSSCWGCSDAADRARSWLCLQEWHWGQKSTAPLCLARPGPHSAADKTPALWTRTWVSGTGSDVRGSEQPLRQGTPLGQGDKTERENGWAINSFVSDLIPSLGMDGLLYFYTGMSSN